MPRSIFGGVRHQPYEPIYNALADLGGSIRQGMQDVSDAKQSAADFTLKSAQVRMGLKKDELAMPGLQAKAREANLYLEEQDRLDEPMTTAHLANSMLGANPEGYTLNHFFGNDIPGAILKTTGTRYDKETDTYIGPAGNIVTKRDFQRNAPMIQATVVAKTDPLKMGQDMLDAAKAKGDAAQVSAIENKINDPQWMLDQYDRQLQSLISAKGAMTQFGYDMTTIDGSITRIYKKQEQIGQAMALDKRLKIKGETLKPGITQKDIAELYIKAYGQVDSDIEARAILGQFEGWDDKKLNAYRRNQAMLRVHDALSTAGVLAKKKPGEQAGGINQSKYRGKGKASSGAHKKAMDAIKKKGDSEKPAQDAAKKTPFWGRVREAIKSMDVTDESIQKNLLDKAKKADVYQGYGDYANKYRPKKKKIDLKKVKAHRRDRRR